MITKLANITLFYSGVLSPQNSGRTSQLKETNIEITLEEDTQELYSFQNLHKVPASNGPSINFRMKIYIFKKQIQIQIHMKMNLDSIGILRILRVS